MKKPGLIVFSYYRCWHEILKPPSLATRLLALNKREPTFKNKKPPVAIISIWAGKGPCFLHSKHNAGCRRSSVLSCLFCFSTAAGNLFMSLYDIPTETPSYGSSFWGRKSARRQRKFHLSPTPQNMETCLLQRAPVSIRKIPSSKGWETWSSTALPDNINKRPAPAV